MHTCAVLGDFSFKRPLFDLSIENLALIIHVYKVFYVEITTNRCKDVEHAQFLDLRSDVRRYSEQGVLPHDKLRIKILETISKWSEEWQSLLLVVLNPSENLEVGHQLKRKSIMQR